MIDNQVSPVCSSPPPQAPVGSAGQGWSIRAATVSKTVQFQSESLVRKSSVCAMQGDVGSSTTPSPDCCWADRRREQTASERREWTAQALSCCQAENWLLLKNALLLVMAAQQRQKWHKRQNHLTCADTVTPGSRQVRKHSKVVPAPQKPQQVKSVPLRAGQGLWKQQEA